MTKVQAIIIALLGAVLIYLGVDGDTPLHQFALVAAGINLCAAFTITGE